MLAAYIYVVLSAECNRVSVLVFNESKFNASLQCPSFVFFTVMAVLRAYWHKAAG